MKKKRLEIENIPSILYGDPSDCVYIYVHGKSSNKEEAYPFAEKATGKKYQVLSSDLPEHGERRNEQYPCNVWNGVRDLKAIGEYARSHWKYVSLYACSIGAYFSLLAYRDFPLQRCLFLSPVLDMERLIENMMKWSAVSEKDLSEKGEIPTPMGETLSWDYYRYAKEHPITQWNVSTAILYGSQDNLTERQIVEDFANRFGCDLTILEGGGHWFHTDKELSFWDIWLTNHLCGMHC